MYGLTFPIRRKFTRLYQQVLPQEHWSDGSETHAGEDFPVFVKGPVAQLVTGVNEQSIIFHVMNEAADLESLAEQNMLWGTWMKHLKKNKKDKPWWFGQNHH